LVGGDDDENPVEDSVEGSVEDSVEDSAKDLEGYSEEEERTNKARKLISHIDSKYGNLDRVVALARSPPPKRQPKDGCLRRQETRAIGYHGGDPPYFSDTVFPMSRLQEPTLHSTRQLKYELDAPTSRYVASELELVQRRKRVEEMTREETDDALQFGANEVRYQHLVPVEGLLEVPKRRISKQVDVKW
jgi:hypothetical protein